MLEVLEMLEMLDVLERPEVLATQEAPCPPKPHHTHCQKKNALAKVGECVHKFY